MRETHICPKCGCRKVWWIEHLSYLEREKGTAYIRHLRLAMERKMADGPEQSTWDRVWHGDSSIYSTGTLDAFTCDDCGYTELYAYNFEELHHNPDCGVHLLEADE